MVSRGQRSARAQSRLTVSHRIGLEFVARPSEPVACFSIFPLNAEVGLPAEVFHPTDEAPEDPDVRRVRVTRIPWRCLTPPSPVLPGVRLHNTLEPSIRAWRRLRRRIRGLCWVSCGIVKRTHRAHQPRQRMPVALPDSTQKRRIPRLPASGWQLGALGGTPFQHHQ